MLSSTRLPLRIHVFQTCTLRHARRYHFASPLLDELEARGMIAQTTNRDAIAQSLQKRQAIYLGIDPTAKSMHVGHLLPFMCLLHFHLRGHSVIPLIGGFTGLVGDPSGKTDERKPLGESTVEGNVESLTAAVQRFFSNATSYASRRLSSHEGVEEPRPPVTANNIEWLGSLPLLDFLTSVGRFARVPTMIRKDSVQLRMNSQQGLSFTEFTYQLLQGYDFHHLYHNRGCTLQLGGSDQWGNILSGVDLISKTRKSESDPAPQGLTTPLLTTASGAKFGKSEGNAVWLDSGLTSVLDFYQFFYRTVDADVGNYLRMFTLKPLDGISLALDKHKRSPEKRTGQQLLADELVELVHGPEAVCKARTATKALYGSSFDDLTVSDIVAALCDDPRLKRVARQELVDESIVNLAAKHGLASSKSEARRLAVAGGLYMNDSPVTDKQTLAESNLLDSGYVVLRAGAKNRAILVVQ